MIKLRNIIDTWNMIEEFGIVGYVEKGATISIPVAEYKRLLASVKNKAYIKNLVK